MLLSHKTKVTVNETQSNIIGHMCYAASKLWNICNYEKNNYKTLGLGKYPDMYYQKKAHKDNVWYKQLPSQSAQEVCKILDKSWKSFFSLKKSKGIENPRPPRFKQECIPITYMQNGLNHTTGSCIVKLTLSRALKQFMLDKYSVDDKFLILENKFFGNIGNIKQLKLYPPENGICEAIVVYEVPDVKPLDDNGKYLSIDLGVNNMMTCFNSDSGETFIAGRAYQSISRLYNKKISEAQKHSISPSKISKLYEKKNNALNDYLHKVTRAVVNYSVANDISTVVIGDITGIRYGKDFGNETNQKLHSFPYAKIYAMSNTSLNLRALACLSKRKASQVSAVPNLRKCQSGMRQRKTASREDFTLMAKTSGMRIQ